MLIYQTIVKAYFLDLELRVVAIYMENYRLRRRYMKIRKEF